ncbi:ribosome biogenesis protein YTM1 [Boletus reticuloceps]|uniref:Ribosome biogenesis protein YTM1 n=1 Tax=Boletus reticuloceps TaxID=495285 RepID=A0A8I3AEK4_9AGAM|nr:ribosome biogenesis protein YTM1 [Boletus reticuloceps]
MASSSAAVVFTTKTPYVLPSQKFMIPLDWKRYQLSQLINKALSLAKPIPFDFLVRGSILCTNLGECRAENGITEEDTLEIEYFESVLPPQRMTTLPQEDWVSSISCRISQHFLTASYDGHIRLFDYAQKLVQDVPAYQAPVTSVCVVPSPTLTDESVLVASGSHDLTASLTRVSLVPDALPPFQTLTSLHLHTSPLSSITSDHTGSHLLTASWDHLIGFWDTTIPTRDEVAPTSDPTSSSDRKKRRKVASEADQGRAKRKAPTTVLKSHTARVSKAVFAPGSNQRAYSCGFDSTVRTWDVELGVCTDTITVPERPMLDLVVTPDGHTVLASSTDRTVSIFDLRSPSLASTTGTLMHPATPSCLVYPVANASETLSPPSTSSAPQVLTGAYDGIARLWDLRSLKSAVASVKAWDGSPKKILSVDWVGEVVGVAGEGGVEVWRVGQGDRVLTGIK